MAPKSVYTLAPYVSLGSPHAHICLTVTASLLPPLPLSEVVCVAKPKQA